MTPEQKKRIYGIRETLRWFSQIDGDSADFLLAIIDEQEREAARCYTPDDPAWIAAQEIKTERDRLAADGRAALEREAALEAEIAALRERLDKAKALIELSRVLVCAKDRHTLGCKCSCLVCFRREELVQEWLAAVGRDGHVGA